jgi:hypothetical protein
MKDGIFIEAVCKSEDEIRRAVSCKEIDRIILSGSVPSLTALLSVAERYGISTVCSASPADSLIDLKEMLSNESVIGIQYLWDDSTENTCELIASVHQHQKKFIADIGGSSSFAEHCIEANVCYITAECSIASAAQLMHNYGNRIKTSFRLNTNLINAGSFIRQTHCSMIQIDAKDIRRTLLSFSALHPPKTHLLTREDADMFNNDSYEEDMLAYDDDGNYRY